MKTVGDFKKAGLVFVDGDMFSDANGNEDGCVAHSINSGSTSWRDDAVIYFDWRENTGKKPSFSGLIEYRHNDGDVETIDTRKVDRYFFMTRPVSGRVTKWRPALNQPTIQTETPEEKEAFEAMTESKPVFTQAMADAGEKVKAGMLFATAAGNQEALMVSDKSVVFEVDGYLRVEIHEFIHPIKTEREKAIDEMIQLDCWATDMEFCEELYNANYRKLTPSQAKAYDDKTEYFGEEYK